MIKATIDFFFINGSMVEMKSLLIGRLIFLGSAKSSLGKNFKKWGDDQKIIVMQFGNQMFLVIIHCGN